jgi:hypothetical protein
MTSGEPKDFRENSPERKCIEFLFYWARQNYGEMAKCLWDSTKRSYTKIAGELRERYSSERLIQFEILEIKDVLQDFTELKIRCWFENTREPKERNLLFRVHNRDKDDKIALWDQPGSQWFLMTYPSPF